MATRARLMLALIGLASVVGVFNSSATAQDPPSKGAQDAPPETTKPKPAPFATRRMPPGSAKSTQANEKAILDGMRWLVRHQNVDGSWSAGEIGARCRSNPPCLARAGDGPVPGDVGVTSLALATFLGAGFSPASRQEIVDTAMMERHKIGAVVGKSVTWLVEQQGEDGSWPVSTCGLENQALGTLVLSEALGASGDPALQGPAQKAVDALQRAQRTDESGGGRSGWSRCSSAEFARSSEPVDVGATAWAVQALTAARMAGLTVDDQALAGAAAFGDEAWRTIERAGPRDARIFPLALMRILLRPVPSDPVLKRVGEVLPEIGKAAVPLDGRAVYEQSFVMVQVHGDASTIRDPEKWKAWNKEVPPAIVAAQSLEPKVCSNGGWLSPDPSFADAGPAAWTALRMLALENYYRYLSKFSAPEPKKPK